MPDGGVVARRTAREHQRATVVAALLAPVLVSWALSVVSQIAPATDVLTLVAIVVLCSATGIRAAGLASALSAAVSFDFFLTQPYHSFAITSPDDIGTAALLLVIGGVVTETARWGERQQAALGQELGYLDGVMATARTVALRVEGPAQITTAVSQRIRELLDLDSCAFVVDGTISPRDSTLEQDGSLSVAGHQIDVDRDGFPVDSTVVLPIRTGGTIRGYFVLTAASHVARPPLEQRRVAVLLADQVAGSLDDRD